MWCGRGGDAVAVALEGRVWVFLFFVFLLEVMAIKLAIKHQSVLVLVFFQLQTYLTNSTLIRIKSMEY